LYVRKRRSPAQPIATPSSTGDWYARLPASRLNRMSKSRGKASGCDVKDDDDMENIIPLHKDPAKMI
jgi:hypothetical protein